MYQFFSRPDRHVGLCGHLNCAMVEREITGAPAFMRGLRALFITDTHVTRRTTEADLAHFVRRIADVRADIILWGGDFADEPEHAARLIERLDGLKPPLGSYAVKGNNDGEAWPDESALKAVLAKAGIRLLVNESVKFSLRGGALTVAGIDEPRYGHPDAAGLYADSSGPSEYAILLSHFSALPKRLPDLVLCGHTHGGQFNLLGITPYTIGFERILHRERASRFIAGLHTFDGARVLVCKGIGASRIPLRIGVRPEMELLAFRA